MALAVLVASCGLVPPVGSRTVVAQVANTGRIAVELAITTTEGDLPGAVQPALLAAGVAGRITFFLPLAGEFEFVVHARPPHEAFKDDVGFPIPGAEFEQLLSRCRVIELEVRAAGDGSIGCTG